MQPHPRLSTVSWPDWQILRQSVCLSNHSASKPVSYTIKEQSNVFTATYTAQAQWTPYKGHV
jgi:hypothetical protein